MTVKEYFVKKSKVIGVDFSESMINDFLSIEGIEDREIDDKDDADKLYLSLVKNLLLRPKSISEGQYSIEYDREGLLKWYSMEAKRLGLDDDMSDLGTVKDMSYLW